MIARASVEIKSIDAASDWADLYRAAKSTTTVASAGEDSSNGHELRPKSLNSSFYSSVADALCHQGYGKSEPPVESLMQTAHRDNAGFSFILQLCYFDCRVRIKVGNSGPPPCQASGPL